MAKLVITGVDINGLEWDEPDDEHADSDATIATSRHRQIPPLHQLRLPQDALR